MSDNIKSKVKKYLIFVRNMLKEIFLFIFKSLMTIFLLYLLIGVTIFDFNLISIIFFVVVLLLMWAKNRNLEIFFKKKINGKIIFLVNFFLLMLGMFIASWNVPQIDKKVIDKEVVLVDGDKYNISYVDKSKLHPAYGLCKKETANVYIRNDLPVKIKNFVKSHELYHCGDKFNFWGSLGRELRANLIPGLKDPWGLTLTIFDSITNPDRVKFYIQRFKDDDKAGEMVGKGINKI